MSKRFQSFGSLQPQRLLKVQGLTCCHTYYSPDTSPRLFRAHAPDDTEALRKKYAPDTRKLDPNSLIWTAHTGIAISKFSTIRHYARRRVKSAFVAALAEKGYQTDGTRVINGVQASALQGTLRFQVDTPAILMHFPQLLQETRLIVQALEKTARPGPYPSQTRIEFRNGGQSQGPVHRKPYAGRRSFSAKRAL